MSCNKDLAGFAVVYFLQELNKKKIPYAGKYFIIPAAVVASVTSWTVTRRKTQSCQRMWMAAEGKLTAFSHYDDEKAMQIPTARVSP